MDIDLEDLISTDAANTAKGSVKFQPKGKPKPKPKPKPKSEHNVQLEPKSISTPPTQFIEVAATTKEQSGNDVNQIIGNVLDSLQSSSERSHEESAESFLPSDSPDVFLPESTTTAVTLPSCSETPTVDASMDGKLEVGPTEPELINNIDASANLESFAEQDPLTEKGATILNDKGDFQTGNVSPGSKSQEAEDSLFWEPLNVLAQSITVSGPRVSKFKPKPKAQNRKMEQSANNPDQDTGPIKHGENVGSVPSQTDFLENEPVPSSSPDEILGTSSIGISDCQVNEAPNLTETSQVDSVNEAGGSSDRLTTLANETLRLVDEDENEDIGDGNNNDDYVPPENVSLTEKKAHKSKKPLNDKKKPVRKRKKLTEIVDELTEVPKKKSSHTTRRNKKPKEVVDELTEVPKKKFSHSTRRNKKAREVADELTEVPKKKFSHTTLRNKRQVNPELLKIPEDELEMHMHNFPLKDLIRLREHKERIEKKEASLLQTDTADQSDQGQNDATYYNYRTHMKITPRVKWTKLDTELFYEAIQQFGTDLSMVTECFPGRTREQIRSKFKKEYKQQRLRIESALNTRAKGHSHFEFVIERLKQARAEDSENDDPVTLTGEEDEVVATDINEGGNVGLEKEVKDMKSDVPAAGAESPIKSNDDEEDYDWSHYKSEI
ncbi:hypothetical protein SSX86_009719 [Deinandra increscens subsp. villosa]|uniref:SANT domain-containing protein n=1 Tax=Deinandra increscens subsp. villosa TaxID=3103831 RepID=A0AAP0DB09_9ASTR